MCGIVGFSGKKSTDITTSVFDVDKIKLLMYYNSIKRTSTDSAGYWHPGLEEPMKNAVSAECLLSWAAYDVLEAETMFIGHVRSKSVGAVSKDNAHPYQIKNLVGVHNGTITNYKHLLQFFGVPYIEGKTDSYYLYQCLVHNHTPEPLRHIEGSAAVLFTDLLYEDTLYVYRKERELYYGYIDGNMYISSEDSSLRLIGCIGIEMFEADTFYKITNAEIVKKLPLKTIAKPKGNFAGNLASRWLLCKETTESGLIKGEWYLCRYTNYHLQTLVLSGGELGTGRVLTPQDPLLEVKMSHFDLTLPYHYTYQSFPGTLMKCLKDITVTRTKDNVRYTAFDKDNIVMVTHVDTMKDHFTALNIIDDQLVSGIHFENLRVCTPQEEKNFKELLDTLKDDVKKEDMGRIRFSEVAENPTNVRLKEFSQSILDKINTSTSKESIIEIKETLKKTIENCETC